MKTQTIAISGDTRSLAQAREALAQLSGVVAAEFVSGRGAVRVWCGDDMTDEMLVDALRKRGVYPS